MYKVLKKDGRVEDFEWKKLIASVIKAGGSKEEAEEVAAKVELWLAKVAEDGTIVSNDLHIKVIDELGILNPKAAQAFEVYRKPER